PIAAAVVNQMLPSAPAAIPDGVPAPVENSVMRPFGVIRPIAPPTVANADVAVVNQRFPSRPRAMYCGAAVRAPQAGCELGHPTRRRHSPARLRGCGAAEAEQAEERQAGGQLETTHEARGPHRTADSTPGPRPVQA